MVVRTSTFKNTKVLGGKPSCHCRPANVVCSCQGFRADSESQKSSSRPSLELPGETMIVERFPSFPHHKLGFLHVRRWRCPAFTLSQAASAECLGQIWNSV